ncbi:Mdm33 family-domain-containing protein [Boletus edulis BED1]|uniref:Sensitive to high expression protein 9, mitochondrial n=1 Tax=Boletus edulis BED1 TaxID=1328754 RepID=A0AAD4BWA7_BOLED|nr:Mdm33 family-domain-containing protein [Boletus edulis BED1]
MLRTRVTDRTSFRTWARSACAYSTRGVGVTPESESNPRSNDRASPTSEHISTAEAHATRPVPGQAQGQSSLNASPSIDLEVLRNRLRDWSVLSSTSLRQRADVLSKKATTTFSHLGQHLNRDDRGRVVEQEARIKATRRAAREAKTAYEDAVLQRSISQRQVNDLLQRKSSWTDGDVSKFTSLEARVKAHVAETEDAVDREFSELMRVILARYHEEQVWSDKIRSASTYGSLAVLGVNLAVFIMAIIVVEPWKRKRLAQTFEKKVDDLGAETKAVVNAGTTRLEERLTEHERVLSELITQVSAETRQGLVTTETASKASPEETAVVLPVPSAHDLMVVAGSAFAGGVIMFLTRSLIAKD